MEDEKVEVGAGFCSPAPSDGENRRTLVPRHDTKY